MRFVSICFIALLSGGCRATLPAGSTLWTYQAGGQVWSPLTHSDGSLYYGSDDGTVTALDVVTQQPRWQFATNGRVRSAATIADQTIVFASDDGFLYAVDSENGTELWRFDLGSAGLERVLPSPNPPYDYDYLHSSPTVSGGIVYIGSADGHLYAIDLVTGNQRWRFATEGRIRSTPAVNAGQLYFGSWDGKVYALDAASGDEIWQYDTGAVIQSSPAVDAEKIYIGSRSARLLALDRQTGTPVWTYAVEGGSWVESTPVLHDGAVYVGSSDALHLLSLDAASGDIRWQFFTGGWSWSSPVVAGENVYVGSVSAFPYYVDGIDLQGGFYSVSAESGTEVWQTATSSIEGYLTGGVVAAARVVDGVVYVASLDGLITAIKE
jgi:outer membrane protein assembly factor BamB